jgi:hypothetical protein
MMEYQDDTGTLLEWGDVMEECVEEVEVVGRLQHRSPLKPVSR